jgi:hypothetical protein
MMNMPERHQGADLGDITQKIGGKLAIKGLRSINFGIWIAEFGYKDVVSLNLDKERLRRVFIQLFGLERMVTFVELVLFV